MLSFSFSLLYNYVRRVSGAMAKYCYNCGNELDDKAVLCVKCGTMVNGSNKKTRDKNKKGLPVWAIVLIVLGCVILLPIIVIVIGFILGINYLEKNDVDINNIIDDIITMKGTIGDSLSDYETRIVLTDALIYSEINGNVPLEGKEYLVFFFEVENLDDESSYVSGYSFDGYVDGGIVKFTSLEGEINGFMPLSGNLDSYGMIRGYVAYEVDTDWNDFSIHYKRSSLDYDSIIFDVTNGGV